MENSFEALIAGYLDDGVGICNGFMSDELAEGLKRQLLLLNDGGQLAAAGTGNDQLRHNTSVRSDAIYWLDKSHNNSAENEFFVRIEGFIKYLNSSCYAGITGYEFHYSLYEAGSFYVKHLDQFKTNSGRQFSMISYLNNNWETKDGGELLIHQPGNNRMIAPEQGRTVFFKSDEKEHEVLVTNERRMSVTGWLKR